MADNLTPRQSKALVALLREPTIRAAAAACKIPEKTLYNWLSDSAFEAAYRRARREAVRQAVARLQQVSVHAVTVLLQLMADPKVVPSTRMGAASKVLDLAIRAVELEDLEARIAALEQSYAVQKQ